MLIDTLHHRTGLRPPNLDFSRLQANLEAFQLAVEHDYKHYQFYANMAVASFAFAVCDQLANGQWSAWAMAAMVSLEALLLVTSRDCLKRFYRRTEQLLAPADSGIISDLDER